MSEPPDIDQLQRLLDGSLDHAEARAVEARLENDPAWQAALEGLSGLPHLTSEYLRPARDRPRPARSDAVLNLIDRLKAKPIPPSSDESWREILTPPPQPNPDEVLGLLGDYEVLELLAQGGMGLVFKARDPSLDRLVAIKSLSPRLATNQTARERFLREARAVAALEHDNILPLYSVQEGDDQGGVPWFAMRYVAGGSLEDLLQESGGALPFDQLCLFARQIASALQAAHDQGIIHRDIKPGNVLVNDERDQVWVTDFGLARAIDDPSLTYPGMVAGTPQFMAPEQAEGGEVDHRTDLFSLGALLYLCATGEPPFSGATSAAVMRQVTHREPQLPSHLNASLPQWFARLLQNLLVKNPAHRFQSAAAVVDAIEHQRAPRPRRKRHRPLLALVAIVVLAGASFLLVQVPAIAYRVNRLLADEARPFLNTKRLGVHASLAAAVAKARPGDVIEIQSDQTLTVTNPIAIPPGRPLTIRAAAGSLPLLDVTPCHEQFLSSKSDLILRGLSVLRNRGGPGILLGMDGGTLTIDRCRIISEGDPGVPHNAETISLASRSHLKITNSALLTSWTFCITLRSTPSPPDHPSISIENCALTGYVMLGLGGTPTTELTLDLDRMVFNGPVMFMNRPDRALPKIVARVSATIFNSESSLWWIPRQSLDDFARQVRWEGRSNLFASGIAYVRNSRLPDRRAGPGLVPSLAAWQALPSVSSHQDTEVRLWTDRNVERRVSANRADITAAQLGAVAAPFLKNFPGIGPDMTRVGPTPPARPD